MGTSRSGPPFTSGKRHADFFADERGVAFVGGVYGYGGVAEHGLGAGGGDGDVAGSVGEGVADVVELAEAFFVLDFEVGDGGLDAGVPVDDVGSAVDEALLVEADEGFLDGDGEAVVHGEVLALPVDGGAEALHLVEDGAAVELAPAPDALDEGFAAELFAGCAFGGELALDHHLGGDAGVVGAGDPEGEVAEHAVPAGEDVHLGLVEHVAHVQAAGDVGRGEEDGELSGVVLRTFGGWDVKQTLPDPVLGPAFFYDRRIVCFRQVFGEFGATGFLAHGCFKGSIHRALRAVS